MIKEGWVNCHLNVPSLEKLMVRSRGVPYLSKPQALLNIFQGLELIRSN
jgi:hypothetical protein